MGSSRFLQAQLILFNFVELDKIIHVIPFRSNFKGKPGKTRILYGLNKVLNLKSIESDFLFITCKIQNEYFCLLKLILVMIPFLL